jgi:MFS family permease
MMTENDSIKAQTDLTKEKKIKKIGTKNFLAILLLGTAGQIAWVMENSNFNTFVYDEITKDPGPVAWMVAISAITATLTTIFMGIKSDRNTHRWGMRKPYIFFGYILWGLMIILFPMSGWIKITGIAVLMVIILDAIMTFFGSTANDAAFNAWITDISHSSNRNRIQTIVSLTAFLAIAITYGVAGVIIDNYGYFVFFYIFGGIVISIGLLSGYLIDNKSGKIIIKSELEPKMEDGTTEDPIASPNKSLPNGEKNLKTKKSTIWEEFKSMFNPQILKDNKILFLLFVYMSLSGIAGQVYTPYIFQYLEHYLGMSKTSYSSYIIIFMPILVICIVIIGWISHKFNRKKLIIVGTIIGATTTIIMGLTSPYIRENIDTIGMVAVLLYVLSQIPTMAAAIAHGGWLLDKYPSGEVGKFQGIRMVFFVAIPMIIGPAIGAFVIRTYGIPIDDGFIPTPEIFIVGGLLAFLSIIPILFIKKEAGKVITQKSDD